MAATRNAFLPKPTNGTTNLQPEAHFRPCSIRMATCQDGQDLSGRLRARGAETKGGK